MFSLAEIDQLGPVRYSDKDCMCTLENGKVKRYNETGCMLIVCYVISLYNFFIFAKTNSI